jgi:hypothetical protein
MATALACALFLAPAAAIGQDVEAEYERRFKALSADDIDGHYRLALWCKDNKAYRLLRKQCTYILRKNSKHEPAALLLELATRELQAAEQRDQARSGTDAAAGALGRILTDQEVQFLRRTELLLDRPERIRVKLHNDVLRRFFAEMEGTTGFPYARKQFFKLPPSEKAQLILKHAPEAFGDDVEILTATVR